eukprot:9496287-Pyramimonas_sp.AAC.1
MVIPPPFSALYSPSLLPLLVGVLSLSACRCRLPPLPAAHMPADKGGEARETRADETERAAAVSSEGTERGLAGSVDLADWKGMLKRCKKKGLQG